MPIYPFRCECGRYLETVRLMRDAAHTEKCPDCGCVMVRVYTPVEVNMGAETGYYNHGLGKYIRHKSDIKDGVRAISDSEGREVVEVGTENAKAKPARREDTIPRGALDGLGE